MAIGKSEYLHALGFDGIRRSAAFSQDLDCPMCGHWVHSMECSHMETVFELGTGEGGYNITCDCQYEARAWDYWPYSIQEVPG